MVADALVAAQNVTVQLPGDEMLARAGIVPTVSGTEVAPVTAGVEMPLQPVPVSVGV